MQVHDMKFSLPRASIDFKHPYSWTFRSCLTSRWATLTIHAFEHPQYYRFRFGWRISTQCWTTARSFAWTVGKSSSRLVPQLFAELPDGIGYLPTCYLCQIERVGHEGETQVHESRSNRSWLQTGNRLGARKAFQWDEVITGHDHDVWGASTRQSMFLLRAVVSSFASNTIREPFTAFQFDKCFRVKEKHFQFGVRPC